VHTPKAAPGTGGSLPRGQMPTGTATGRSGRGSVPAGSRPPAGGAADAPRGVQDRETGTVEPTPPVRVRRSKVAAPPRTGATRPAPGRAMPGVSVEASQDPPESEEEREP